MSSSSQEPRVASIAVQTPSKLLKDLISTTSKISKEELRQLKEKVVVCIFQTYIYMYLVCKYFFREIDFFSRKKILVSQIFFDQMYIFFQIRAEVEADKDQEKKRAVNVATRSLERDLERLKADHATEIEQLNERHKETLTESKKKQWVRGRSQTT